MRKVQIFIFPLAFFFPLSSTFAEPSTFFVEGAHYYQKGEYEKARDEFKKSVSLEPEDGLTWYNLGNTEHRLGNPAGAIFSYKMAKKYLPRNPEIDFNLNFLRSKRRDQIQRRSNLLSRVAGFYAQISAKEGMGLLVLITFTLFALLLYSRSLSRSSRYKWISFAKVILMIVFILLLYYPFQDVLIKRDFGVVKSTEIHVTSGRDRDSVVLFQLHEASEFEVLEISETGEWLLIRIPDGKTGWVQKKDVITSV